MLLSSCEALSTPVTTVQISQRLWPFLLFRIPESRELWHRELSHSLQRQHPMCKLQSESQMRCLQPSSPPRAWQGSRRWLTKLGSCLPHGKTWRQFLTLALVWPSPRCCGHFRSKLPDRKSLSSLSLLFCLSNQQEFFFKKDIPKNLLLFKNGHSKILFKLCKMTQ